MTMDRTKFATLADKALIIREANKDAVGERGAWTRGDLLLVDGSSGTVVATVKQSDLFDADGNRFEYE
jgi:hypothetical protein